MAGLGSCACHAAGCVVDRFQLCAKPFHGFYQIGGIRNYQYFGIPDLGSTDCSDRYRTIKIVWNVHVVPVIGSPYDYSQTETQTYNRWTGKLVLSESHTGSPPDTSWGYYGGPVNPYDYPYQSYSVSLAAWNHVLFTGSYNWNGDAVSVSCEFTLEDIYTEAQCRIDAAALYARMSHADIVARYIADNDYRCTIFGYLDNGAIGEIRLFILGSPVYVGCTPGNTNYEIDVGFGVTNLDWINLAPASGTYSWFGDRKAYFDLRLFEYYNQNPSPVDPLMFGIGGMIGEWGLTEGDVYTINRETRDGCVPWVSHTNTFTAAHDCIAMGIPGTPLVYFKENFI